MADQKIIDLTALVSPTSTDLYETSLNGAGSRKETRAQMLTYMKTNIAPLTTKGDMLGFSTIPVRVPVGTNGQVPVADSTAAPGWKWADAAASAVLLNNVYVSGDHGSDVTGDGTISNPWETYDFAITQISGLSQVVINLDAGVYSLTAMELIPNILLRGSGERQTQIAITGGAQEITLSTDWDGISASSEIQNLSFVDGTGINFDSTALTAFAGNIGLRNLSVSGEVKLTSKTGHTFNCEAINNDYTSAVTATDIFNYVGSLNTYDSFQLNGVTTNATANLRNEKYLGIVTAVASSSPNATIYLTACGQAVQLESTGANATILADAVSYISPNPSTGLVTRLTKNVAIEFLSENIVSTPKQMQWGRTYYVSVGSQCQMTLPPVSEAKLNDTLTIVGMAAAGYRLVQNAAQTNYLGNTPSTTGTGGYIEAVNGIGDIIIVRANTGNVMFSSADQGNFNVV
jgi:hypothetical protein